jgi:hypothetical protein
MRSKIYIYIGMMRYLERPSRDRNKQTSKQTFLSHYAQPSAFHSATFTSSFAAVYVIKPGKNIISSGDRAVI